jgi:hypothetical protein
MVDQQLSAWPGGRPEEEIRLKRCHDEMASKVKQVSVTFFAKTGNGKSSSANTLLQAWGHDGPGFEARRQREMVTRYLQTIEQPFKDPLGSIGAAGGDLGAAEDHIDAAERPTTTGDGEGEQKDGTSAEGDPGPLIEPAEGNGDGDQGEGAAADGDGEGKAAAEAVAVQQNECVLLRVTDQPGLMDSTGPFVGLTGEQRIDEEDMRRSTSSGEHQNGYHVLFLAQKITDRLDAGELAILRIVHRFYGKAAHRHIVLLLTYSDVLDSEDEITRMSMEAKADVEAEIGGEISRFIAINNHPTRTDAAGKDRQKAGREMISVIHDIVCSEEGPDPFRPREVEYETVVKYVEEEAEKNPALKKDALLEAVLRFVPCNGRKKLCAIL